MIQKHSSCIIQDECFYTYNVALKRWEKKNDRTCRLSVSSFIGYVLIDFSSEI